VKEIVVSAEHKYSVKFVDGWRDQLPAIFTQYSNHLVLAPASLRELLELETVAGISGKIYYLPDGEEQKSNIMLAELWNLAGELNLNRDSVVIGIGGGATTDLAGFFAATWLRGVDWFAFPTSLAGMVDAAVGGKTGINTSAGKNLVGSFHSPQGVLIDSGFLKTLPERDLCAGMAEVIKCGFISDPVILELASDYQANLDELIFRAVAVKARVVSEDFKESHLREILNYGHTLGHAIEKREKYSLRHGEAVSIGMIFAAQLSVDLAGLDQAVLQQHRNLLSMLNLPITYPSGAFEELLGLMNNDKKRRDNSLRFVGLSNLATPTWLDSVTTPQLKAAYERICS